MPLLEWLERAVRRELAAASTPSGKPAPHAKGIERGSLVPANPRRAVMLVSRHDGEAEFVAAAALFAQRSDAEPHADLLQLLANELIEQDVVDTVLLDV